MYNIVINIIAWLAIIWFLILLFWNIFLYIDYCVTSNYKLVGIRRTTYLFTSEYGSCYIFPCVSFNFKTNYKTIEFYWYKYEFTMTYHILTDVEEEAEAKVRLNLEKENEP